MENPVRKSILMWLCLSPLVILILFPFAVMISTAVKPRVEVLMYPPSWFPSEIRLQNFVDMWQATRLGPAVLNSLIVSITATVLCLLVAIPAAYAAARMEFTGRKLFRQFLLVTQMLSPIVLVLGIFRLMAKMGFVDQLPALVLAYVAFNLAFSVWMLQAYFQTIPRELEEAATLDGASAIQRLWRIFLPLAIPAIGITAVFIFIYCWNEFVLAMTLLRTPEKSTLTLQTFSLVGGRYQVEWDHVMAATLVASVPVAVIFALLQRSLVSGLTVGAVK
ncbi:carbohydrate ABC transporter permease [Kaistia nematophila]|uniref:Maltose/maltodextrin transport system permease protein MalG n=1 Tax=Kaistia nematophila TaxID=2994654 RepID=A0A9X3INH6_9HYPH|nr:carbohydrate ABC transporter permease [Kaistia nematophila]MCX5571982.1 carbohydrate ABC transporter permease [Kaistia nematophila]